MGDILVVSWCSMYCHIVGHKKRGMIPRIERVAGVGLGAYQGLGACQVEEAYLALEVGPYQGGPLGQLDQQVPQDLGVLVLRVVPDRFLKYEYRNE